MRFGRIETCQLRIEGRCSVEPDEVDVTTLKDDPGILADGQSLIGFVVPVNGGVFRILLHGTSQRGMIPNRCLSVHATSAQLEERRRS